MDEISRVNRGLMCPAVTTGRVLGGAVVGAIVRHAGAIVRLGQRGAGGGRADAPRRGRHGYFARQAVAGRMWAGPWQGGYGPMQDPAATSAALPCGRGSRGRGISCRNNSAGKVRSGPAREVPAPPSARDVQAGPAQGPAATSTALPCGRGCRGRGISLRSSSAGAIRGASARDVQAGPAQGPAATSAALPCRRGAGDTGFHVGTVPK